MYNQLSELGIQMEAQLAELAFTHRSYAYENGGVPTNERLEFLGDAVLEIIVTEYLYRTFPEFPEGRLAKLRAAVVSAAALSEVAKDLGLGPMIKLGKGEMATGGEHKTSILADTLEAVIGSIFLSSGMTGAEAFVGTNIFPRIHQAASLGASLDPKTELQEYCTANKVSSTYQISESGPDHAKVFSVELLIDGQVVSTATGTSKRQAEQRAAAAAVGVLRA